MELQFPQKQLHKRKIDTLRKRTQSSVQTTWLGVGRLRSKRIRYKFVGISELIFSLESSEFLISFSGKLLNLLESLLTKLSRILSRRCFFFPGKKHFRTWKKITSNPSNGVGVELYTLTCICQRLLVWKIIRIMQERFGWLVFRTQDFGDSCIHIICWMGFTRIKVENFEWLLPKITN